MHITWRQLQLLEHNKFKPIPAIERNFNIAANCSNYALFLKRKMKNLKFKDNHWAKLPKWQWVESLTIEIKHRRSKLYLLISPSGRKNPKSVSCLGFVKIWNRGNENRRKKWIYWQSLWKKRCSKFIPCPRFDKMKQGAIWSRIQGKAVAKTSYK